MKQIDNRAELLNNFFLKIAKETYPEPLSDLHTKITNDTINGLLKKYSFPSNAKILDIGCGQGPALDFFSKSGFKPVGIALNDEDVNVCITKGFEVYKMDQSFLEFENDTFDFIWARHCIEHSIAPYLTLSEFYRVSKVGSYLYIEVPAPDTAAHHETNPNHYSVLTKSMWSSLITRSGFSIVDAGTLNLQLTIGNDEYWAFMCKCIKQEGKSNCSIKNTRDFSAQKTVSNPNSIDENIERIQSLLARQDLAAALNVIELTLKQYSESTVNKYNIEYYDLLDIAGNLALGNNKPELAQKYFEEELNLVPTSSTACTGLGKVFFTEEKYEHAKIMFEWGAKNNPENNDAVESLAMINNFLGLEEKHTSLVEG